MIMPPFPIASRSMGLKLIVICGLAILMTIPAFFVDGLVNDRTQRAAQVTAEISARSGGQQTFLGPTLVIPFGDITQNTYAVFPTKASASLRSATEVRRRSLFEVPVFQADLTFDADFDLTGVPSPLPNGSSLHWDQAEIVVGVSDPRGALADATLTMNGKTVALVPTDNGVDIAQGDQDRTKKLAFFGADLNDLAKPGAKFKAVASLRFSGAQRVAVLSWGKNTHLTATGDWPTPGFDGDFLPLHRTIDHNRFTAEWSVPFIARGVPAEGRTSSLSALANTALGISFVQVADPYQSVSRSLKYTLLFTGLIFLAYFSFEVATGKRVHPAQYILVGVAQMIFYLLLLSLAERIGFGAGFLVAGAATVLLLSINARWVFSSIRQGVLAFICFSLLYALIYVLLRMEDEALLVGAIASFVAVAAAMYLTRRIDWYGAAASGETERQVI